MDNEPIGTKMLPTASGNHGMQRLGLQTCGSIKVGDFKSVPEVIAHIPPKRGKCCSGRTSRTKMAIRDYVAQEL